MTRSFLNGKDCLRREPLSLPAANSDKLWL
jgi:hypothetical protein